MLTKSTAVLTAVVFLFALTLPLAAQNASLVGTVKDQQGGAMANVHDYPDQARKPASA